MRRTRIAPTPSGYLHMGNAYSFVLTWIIAQHFEAKIFLRIDDIDDVRKRPEYVEDIFYTLDWLGLAYDEGPTGPDDVQKNYSQHLRIGYYEEFLEQLRQKDSLFCCTCSRKQIQDVSKDGQYPGTCLHLGIPWDQPASSWRLHTPNPTILKWKDLQYGKVSIALHESMRDFVVRKKDRLPSYQLVSYADDLYFDMDLIVRGEDLLASTAAQMYIDQILMKDKVKNFHFVHHPLITDSSGNKLSKSQKAHPLKDMRSKTSTPEIFYHWVSRQLHLESKCSSIHEILEVCDISNVLKYYPGK